MEHHAASFRRAARNDALADAVHADFATAPLVDADRALADFAVHLTRTPSLDGAGRIDRLRTAGFDDAAILAATEITGYFNFVNRLAEGLCVELE